MRVIRHSREDLEIELAGTNYYLFGSFGNGETWDSSVFLVTEIDKIVEDKKENLSDLEIPCTSRLADIDEKEKQWVRDTVCTNWQNDDSGYNLSSHFDISFYDKEGNFLCTNANRINVLTISAVRLEIHMDETIVQFKGENRNDTFIAKASSMMGLYPNEHIATKEEFDTCVNKLKQYYKGLPHKKHRVVFVDDRGKKLSSIR